MAPLPRCQYLDARGRQCRRAGLGSPALCRPHYEAVHYAANPGSTSDSRADLSSFLEQIARHPATATHFAAVVQRVYTGARERFRQRRHAARHYAESPAPPPGTPPGANAPPSDWWDDWDPEPEPRPRPPPARGQTRPPRIVLGFRADTVLTREVVRRRRNELAAIYHPDRGGSDEAMREINAAADALLSRL